jgi:hypothetical protein
MGIRLGVGAPLHETPVPTQARLVQKLEAGKRRTRDRENGDLAETATAAMANNRRSEREGEDSMEESRVASARVIRKRPRIVDPFEPGGGGKSRKRTLWRRRTRRQRKLRKMREQWRWYQLRTLQYRKLR